VQQALWQCVVLSVLSAMMGSISLSASALTASPKIYHQTLSAHSALRNAQIVILTIVLTVIPFSSLTTRAPVHPAELPALVGNLYRQFAMKQLIPLAQLALSAPTAPSLRLIVFLIPILFARIARPLMRIVFDVTLKLACSASQASISIPLTSANHVLTTA
jgi:hypothetical protein